jgi:hypothetical protein
VHPAGRTQKKARVDDTGLDVKVAAERLGANEGGREEEENGSEIAALLSERLGGPNSVGKCS